MNDDRFTQSFAEGDDPALDQLLGRLVHLAPAPGFVDRVMVRVRRPVPAWLRSTQRLGQSLVRTRRRALTLGGGFAVSSVVSMSIVAVLASQSTVQLAAFWAWLTQGLSLGLWRTLVTSAARLVHTLTLYSQALTVAALVLGTISLAVAAFVSLWGMHRLMSELRMRRVPVNAIR